MSSDMRPPTDSFDDELRGEFRNLPPVVARVPKATDARWFRAATNARAGGHFMSQRLPWPVTAMLMVLTASVVAAPGGPVRTLIMPTARQSATPTARALPTATATTLATVTASPAAASQGTATPAQGGSHPTLAPLPTAPHAAPPATAAPAPPPATQAAGCPSATWTKTGTVSSGNSVSFFFDATSTTLCATMTWTGSTVLDLVIDSGDGSRHYAQVSPGTSPETLRIAVTPGVAYKVKAKPETGGTSTFTLTVNS